jgi:hypothetical protein
VSKGQVDSERTVDLFSVQLGHVSQGLEEYGVFLKIVNSLYLKHNFNVPVCHIKVTILRFLGQVNFKDGV